MVYPRQKYRSRLPFLFPGDLLDPGIEPVSRALQVDSFAIKPPGKLHSQLWKILILTSLSTNKVKGLKCYIAITTKYYNYIMQENVIREFLMVVLEQGLLRPF